MPVVAGSLAPRHERHERHERHSHGIHVAFLPARFGSAPVGRAGRATYARRRLGALVVGLTAVAAFAASIGAMPHVGLADRGGGPASAAAIGQANTYIVRSGDTLWTIAERLFPGADLAVIVDAMVSLNGGVTIQVGQSLRLP
jgi:LysM domain